MSLLQIAGLVGVLVVAAGWCLRRALAFGPMSIVAVHRRLYGPVALDPVGPAAMTTWWERPAATLGRRLSASSPALRLAEKRRFQLAVAEVSAVAVATRVVTAAFVGFVATATGLSLPVVAGAPIPWAVAVIAPFAMAAFTGWYQLSTISTTLQRRYAGFRGGVGAYVQLVAVCLTTRRSASESITYAATVGTGRAFEVIAAAVHAAPAMGRQSYEALEAVGAEYGARELEDLASSIANVANIGVGVDATVVNVAARMRQVALDDLRREADRQTSTMFGPTMLFVLGTIVFLGYPLSQRVLDAFAG